MKRIAWIKLLLITQVLSACGSGGIPSVVTMRIVNDEGVPIPDLAFLCWFYSPSGSVQVEAKTDNQGMAIVSGLLRGPFNVRLEHDGYYPTRRKFELTRDEYLARKPWNPTLEIEFRRIRNPIPMFVKELVNPHVSLRLKGGGYNTNSFAQYDMLKADFLPPYGEGEVADVEFIWKIDIYSYDKWDLPLNYDTYFNLKFSNDADGIMRGEVHGLETGLEGSTYIAAYEAPLEGYSNSISFFAKVKKWERETNNDEHPLYYFRVRTQTNEVGEIANAYYGKIYGTLDAPFVYYINLTSNDQNIEYDQLNNLNENFRATRRIAP